MRIGYAKVLYWSSIVLTKSSRAECPLQRLLALPRWKEHGGLNFAVHIEHPFVPDNVLRSFCQLTQALILHSENTTPYSCPPPRVSKTGLVLPYSSHNSYLASRSPAKQRTKFLFFLGACFDIENPDEVLNMGRGPQGIGKNMRLTVVHHLQRIVRSMAGDVEATLSWALNIQTDSKYEVKRTRFSRLICSPCIWLILDAVLKSSSISIPRGLEDYTVSCCWVYTIMMF